jgi:hypothetical protein
MSRLAGDTTSYTFALLNKSTGEPTLSGFDLVSVTTFLKSLLGPPAQAMAYHGLRIALGGVYKTLLSEPEAVINAESPEELEVALKERGISPNQQLTSAGQRGHAAHEVLELMAADEIGKARVSASLETGQFGTQYGEAAISFWDEQVQPNIDSGQILQVLSEVPVWSLKHAYCGTLDLAIEWAPMPAEEWGPGGWEILDAKTHKPAKGFTLEGRGCGYDTDAAQCRAYRMAFEEMGLGQTIGQRTVVLRENGKYLTDEREVSEDTVISLRRLYDERLRYEGKTA